MTIFSDDDFSNVPILSALQIVGELHRHPQVFGVHQFHEGTRVAAEEIIVVDPALRWLITPYGGYRLGGGTLATTYFRFGIEREITDSTLSRLSASILRLRSAGLVARTIAAKRLAKEAAHANLNDLSGHDSR